MGKGRRVKGRVLVVDDDATILEVLEMRLTAKGFEVTATTDAIAVPGSDSHPTPCGRIRNTRTSR